MQTPSRETCWVRSAVLHRFHFQEQGVLCRFSNTLETNWRWNSSIQHNLSIHSVSPINKAPIFGQTLPVAPANRLSSGKAIWLHCILSHLTQIPCGTTHTSGSGTIIKRAEDRSITPSSSHRPQVGMNITNVSAPSWLDVPLAASQFCCHQLLFPLKVSTFWNTRIHKNIKRLVKISIRVKPLLKDTCIKFLRFLRSI